MSARLAAASLAVLLAACGPAQPAAEPAAAPSAVRPAPSAAPEARHHGEHHAHHQEPTATHRFDDPERWAKVFDDPARDAWQKPDDVVRELGLGPSDVVADLGAGTGYFTVRLSRAVPSGKVLAVEVEPKLVEHIERRAKEAGLSNIEPILGAADDPKLPSGVKVVLVVDTYHHIGQRTAYFARVKQRLTPAGRVVIVDFKKGKLPVGPPDGHKLAPEIVEKEMKAAGYSLCRAPEILPHQYVLVFAEKC